MATIEEMLRNTLKGVNDQHSRGTSDLHRAVVEVARAVQSISAGTLSIYLRTIRSSPVLSVYALYAAYRNDSPRFVSAYAVPVSGYPIAVGYDVEDVLSLSLDRSDEAIHEAAQLDAHFQRMATDPESPIVTYLAYAVRQLNEDKAEEMPAAG